MTQPTTITKDYILLTSDEEIKEEDCYLSPSGIWFYNHLNPNHIKKCKKVIAHLPLKNSPILEGVPLLPPLPDEVEKMAEKEFPNLYQPIKGLDTTLLLREGFQYGYNKAKEKYKYTEEDVIKIVEKSRETGLTAECLILFLSQPKLPVGFKPQIADISSDGQNEINVKLIINGVMQGEWIYNN